MGKYELRGHTLTTALLNSSVDLQSAKQVCGDERIEQTSFEHAEEIPNPACYLAFNTSGSI